MQPILAIKVHTSGLPQWGVPSESPSQPHIVKLQMRYTYGGADIHHDIIIKPEGWEIEEEAAAVHGITQQIAASRGIPEPEALQIMLDLWENGKALIVGHNVSFDMRILRIALKRYRGDEAAELFKITPTDCTQLIAKPLMALPSEKRGFRAPKLDESCKFFIPRDISGCTEAYKISELYQALKKF